MAAAMSRALALLLAGRAAALQQDATLLLQASAASAERRTESLVVTDQAVTESLDYSPRTLRLLDPTPEWCKNETELDWKQRKERMQQHTTLQWCKKQYKDLTERNESVPQWMEKMVTEDENRGKMKWAVQEAKRLRAEQKEVPQYMVEMVAEDARWANRWAACKVAELRQSGNEVPAWMVQNARDGLTEYASEKAQELQDEIQELEEEREKEAAIVRAQGDAVEANRRLLARTRKTFARSTEQQLRVVQEALEELDQAETAGGDEKRVKRATIRAKEASDMLNQMLAHKMDVMKAKMELEA